jgi:VWFA-related protein
MPSRVACAAVLFFSIILVAGGRPSGQQAPPRFTSGVDLVAVDVTVLGADGAPLPNLSIADFAVTVDGKPRKVTTIRFVQADIRRVKTPGETPPDAVSAPPPSAPPPAPAPGRLFVMAIDRQHIPSGEGLAMLDAAAKFIDTLLPEDKLAVWTIPPTSPQVRLSADREAAKDAVRKAPGLYRPPLSKYRVGPYEAIQVEEGHREVFEGIVARECDATGETTPPLLAQCRVQLEAEVRTTVFDWHNRAQTTLSILEDLVRALGPVDGPKHVVLLTGGPVFSKTELSRIASTSAAAGESRVTIHAIQVHQPSARASTESMRSTPEETDQLMTAAVALATSTGGLWITPAAPAVAFERLSKELSASYVLGFEPEPGDRDGKSHEIDVKVKAAGWRGLVRARKSFRIDPASARVTPAAPAEQPVAPAAAPPAPEPVAADLDAIVERLGEYVDRFDRQFAGFVAEERYVQVIHPWRGNPTSPDNEKSLTWQEGEPSQHGAGIVTRRQLLSDILLVPVKGQAMAFRDVAVVDGRQLRDRVDRVRSLFLSASPDRVGQLRVLNEESSRYNIGDFKRTLNVPTVVLAFMRRSEQHRFRFRRLKDEEVNGRMCRAMSYTEKESPTLVGTPNGGDIPVEGRVWIDAATGDVLRTELRFEPRGGRRSFIQVDFDHEPRTSVLVPARMWEWYEGVNSLGRIGGDKTLLEAVATYSNFRHFEVTTNEQVK